MTRTFAVLACLLGVAPVICFATSPSFTYTAAGTMGTAISGSDTFRLAGEPFNISITASDAQLSSYHGPTYAGYVNLKMTGTISSHLTGGPIDIASHVAWIVMANGNPTNDIFQLGSQVKVIGLTFTFSATAILPKGSLTTVRNHAFGPVALTVSNATMTYSAGSAPTVLGLIGNLYSVPASGAQAAVFQPAALALAPPALIRRRALLG